MLTSVASGPATAAVDETSTRPVTVMLSCCEPEDSLNVAFTIVACRVTFSVAVCWSASCNGKHTARTLVMLLLACKSRPAMCACHSPSQPRSHLYFRCAHQMCVMIARSLAWQARPTCSDFQLAQSCMRRTARGSRLCLYQWFDNRRSVLSWFSKCSGFLEMREAIARHAGFVVLFARIAVMAARKTDPPPPHTYSTIITTERLLFCTSRDAATCSPWRYGNNTNDFE